ncbi:hypothetical protein CHS0354_035256 [Potamilus streckersoni]|uniref:rhomboid protease n=1 Tax=Potamilus streckersoni TaxID=2493646 RepID=A0AAE0VPF5_9BIVA|nr:hypothetical protein CHS0354_035256 [Potamilus streckersoni]
MYIVPSPPYQTLSAGWSVPYQYLNGEFWRLISAIYLHGNIIHIAFNMLTLKQIFPLTGRGIAGNVVAMFAGIPVVGASGAIFGIVGSVIAAAKTDCAAMGKWAFIMVIFGFVFPGISNAAHIGGLICGLLVGRAVTYSADELCINKQKIIMSNRISAAVFLLTALTLVSCDQPKLDEYGGYYNEKLGQYVYVNPKVNQSVSNIKLARPGEIQSAEATVALVDRSDGVWLEIENRDAYMLLAQNLAKSYRNDKQRRFLVMLKFVNPGFIESSKAHKKKWQAYVAENLAKILTGKKVRAEMEFFKPGAMKGIIFYQNGSESININLWMVAEGLSYYFKDAIRQNPEEELYVRYQQTAESQRKGLWSYQR